MEVKLIEETIGGTPLVRSRRIDESLPGNLFFKLEFFNPMGSVKDRIAWSMLERAQMEGEIGPGVTVIEPTSGNTGIGLAFLCASRGIRLILTMPVSMSLERRKVLEILGAELVLTEAERGMAGAMEEAERLHATIPDSIILDQFRNPANPEIHYRTTGPEIYRALEGRIDVFVAGVGTGGTITGVGMYLKEKRPETVIVAVEPARSAVLSGNPPGSHQIMGIGAGFIPPLLERSLLDEIIRVDDEEAINTARRLACEEGILTGISGGAATFAALKVASRPEFKDRNIVLVLPDHGERYLSTKLFNLQKGE